MTDCICQRLCMAFNVSKIRLFIVILLKIAEYSQEVNNRITQEVKNVLLIAKNTNESNEVLIIGNTLFSQKAVVLGTEYGVKIESIKKPVMRI